MYKVLITEDENIIRKGLIYMVDWKSFGCTVAAEAENGEDGIHKIRELRPDIVITDIKMPIMDGLNMISSTCKDFDYESIVISGYGEFEYAKQAIDCGVTEYLLKPVETEKIGDALKRATAKVEAKQKYKMLELLSQNKSRNQIVDSALFSEKNRQMPNCVKKTMDYIEGHFSEKISLSKVSGLLQVSSTYLNQNLKEFTGYTFSVLLNRYRIKQAVAMLSSTDDKIYEIAEKTGFDSYKYFILVFKKLVGCTPMEFARTNITLQSALTGIPKDSRKT